MENKELVAQAFPIEIRDSLLEKIKQLSCNIQELVINTQREWEVAGALLGDLRGFQKQAKELEADQTRPLKEQIDKIRANYSFWMNDINLGEQTITTKTREYQRQQLLSQQEAQRKADAEAKKALDKQVKKGITPDVPVPVAQIIEGPTKQLKTDGVTLSTIFVWKWKFASSMDNDIQTTKVPKRYFQFNIPAINKYVKDGIFTKIPTTAAGEWLVKELPGIIVYQDVNERARSK